MQTRKERQKEAREKAGYFYFRVEVRKRSRHEGGCHPKIRI